MAERVDQHELISALKALAIEIGRTPTRDEYIAKYGSKEDITRAFGTYSAFIQASGLAPVRVRQRKIDNSVWQRDLEQHLEEYVPREVPKKETYRHVLFIPDTHFPFACQKTLEFIYRIIERDQPEEVIQLGDLYDRYAHSRFPRSHNVYTPEQEDELARKAAETMWSEVHKAAPKAKRVQLLGNHDLRPLKQILAAYPQAEKWAEKMLAESMSFEGVQTIVDHREEYKLPGNVDVIHGNRTKLGEHRDYSLTNVVHGHDHKLGVVYRTIRGIDLWEMSCGHAGDVESKAMGYTPTKTVNWQKGCGKLDEDGPRTIALR